MKREWKLAECALLQVFLQDRTDRWEKISSHGMKISINKVYEILNKKPNQFVIKNNDILVAIYELDLNVNCYRAVRVWN